MNSKKPVNKAALYKLSNPHLAPAPSERDEKKVKPKNKKKVTY